MFCDADQDFMCGACNQSITVDDCDTIGACPGSLFCPECNEEIGGDGEPTPLCGECEGCKLLISMGEFEIAKSRRAWVANSR